MRGQGQQGLAFKGRAGGLLLVEADEQQRGRAVPGQRSPSAPDPEFNINGLFLALPVPVFQCRGRVIAIRRFPWPAQGLEIRGAA